ALKSATEATEADAEDIKAKTQTLMEVSMKLGQAIYEAQQAEGGATADASAEEGGDNVVDADYEEIKDDDRKKSA
ncbi:molecular chaperone DnaK, partial [Rhizobium phaseoli]